MPFSDFTFFFFFTDPAPTEIYTLSLHDALPISMPSMQRMICCGSAPPSFTANSTKSRSGRSEEHTSELQSLTNLVCRLLLEKKKKKKNIQKSTKLINEHKSYQTSNMYA